MVTAINENTKRRASLQVTDDGRLKVAGGGTNIPDYIGISATTQVAAAGKIYESSTTDPAGCTLTLPAGIAEGCVVGVMVQKGSGGTRCLGVAGAGATLVSNGTAQVVTEGVIMSFVRTSVADQWLCINNEPTEPKFVGYFDDFPALQAAYANASAGLFAIPEGSWAICRKVIAGTGGYPARFYRSYAAVQADVKWEAQGPVVWWMEAANTGWNVIYPLAGVSVSSVSSASGGAATRLQFSAAHGLPNLANLQVYTLSGAGYTPGLVPFTYVDANNVDIAVPYNGNIPTLRVANGSTNETLLKRVSYPAALMQAFSQVDIHSLWDHTASASNKYTKIKHGATNLLNALGTNGTNTAYPDFRTIANVGSTSIQVGRNEASQSAFLRTDGAVTASTIATASGGNLDFVADLPVGGIFMRLRSLRIVGW